MFLGVNTVTLRPSEGGGEEHYLCNLLATLREAQQDLKFLVFTDTQNHDFFADWDCVCVGAAGSGRLGGLNAALEKAARQAKPDLLFTPLQTALSKSAVPQAIFALDFEIGDRNPPQRRDPLRLRSIKRTCQKAAVILAPSKFVKRRLCDTLELPLDKVAVTPLGVSEQFDAPQPCVVDPPFLLTVGMTRERKNLLLLRDAVDRVQRHAELPLVVVGRPGAGEPESWGDRAIRLHRCPTATLAGLYQHCAAFITASLYEGSGVTVCEAMRCAAPTACSKVGGIPEVGGDVPVYFDPANVRQMTEALLRALDSDTDAWTRRLRYGQRIAAQFTWKQCAWQTLGALRKA